MLSVLPSNQSTPPINHFREQAVDIELDQISLTQPSRTLHNQDFLDGHGEGQRFLNSKRKIEVKIKNNGLMSCLKGTNECLTVCSTLTKIMLNVVKIGALAGIGYMAYTYLPQLIDSFNSGIKIPVDLDLNGVK